MNNQVLTILAKVVDFMASSETYTLTTRIEEWHKLHDLLEYWNSSVKDKGFMDPVSVLDEGDKVLMYFTQFSLKEPSSWQMFHLAQILFLIPSSSRDSNCLFAFRKIEVSVKVRVTPPA
ncbi:hypothetical protein PENVUL_c031G01794 [Penicillium vulpinum]|uniref:Uncharacterized protein n=1 Tax=Penicillium vulpinum TaxID=29845 RepID=A0A1V6RSL4_9EURO|nr:hypothetical protein PENVUL_c031G01794 [Penicillium vulpinum]